MCKCDLRAFLTMNESPNVARQALFLLTDTLCSSSLSSLSTYSSSSTLPFPHCFSYSSSSSSSTSRLFSFSSLCSPLCFQSVSFSLSFHLITPLIGHLLSSPFQYSFLIRYLCTLRFYFTFSSSLTVIL